MLHGRAGAWVVGMMIVAACASCRASKENVITVAAECTSSDTCIDDGNPCTDERCEEGVCKHDALADRSPCPGGLCWATSCCQGCWDGEKCDEFGATVASCGREGAACKSCDDGDSCTLDSCSERECAHGAAPDGSACDDGFEGACRAGRCSCGQRSEPCCSGALCESALACTEGVCVTCGKTDEPCCSGASCESGSVCADDRCQACGRAGQPCCEGSSCDDSHTCQGGACVPCGGPHQACCSSGERCNATGYECSAGSCLPCGGRDEPCCAGDVCLTLGDDCTTESCVAGTCLQQAALDETPCAQGGACRSGACCAGCWDPSEAACKSGVQLTACGGAGALCESCDDGSECTHDTCALASRSCEHVPRPEGAPCAGGRCSGGACFVCGDDGQSCCDMTLPLGAFPCADGSNCASDMCVACGGVDEPCCTHGVKCEAETTCVSSKCQPCGRMEQRCCDGSSCASAALTCSGQSSGCYPCSAGAVMALSHACGASLGETDLGIPTFPSLSCWGRFNPAASSGGTSAVPIDIAPPAGAAWASSLALGESHTCIGATGANSGVYCWGLNAYHQLGDGTTTPSEVPVKVTGTALDQSEWLLLAAGSNHTCYEIFGAQTSIRCWGRNDRGQLGVGHTNVVTGLGQALALGAVGSLRAGGDHTCAASSAGVWCWGRNDRGQLGLGSASSSVNTPTQLSGLTIRQLAAGFEHTCVITMADELKCWGAGDHGQLGLGDKLDRTQPASVTLPGVPKELAAGYRHTCAIVEVAGESKAYCWGANDHLQLGTTGLQETAAPLAVSTPASLTPAGLTAGGNGTCVVTDLGQTLCWGADGEGQLGNGVPFEDIASPTAAPVSCGAL